MHSVKTLISLYISYTFAQDAASSAASASPSVPLESLQTSAPGVISPDYVLQGFDGCDSNQETAIKDGFADMITMLMSNDLGLYPDVDWNSAVAQDFWGSYEFNSEVRDHIKGNLDRAATVTYQWWINPFASRLRARCDDPLNECICKTDGYVDAYTVSHGPEVNFCEHYFYQPTLSAALEGPILMLWERIDAFLNQATIWAHELMHIRQIGHPIDELHGGIVDQLVQGWPGLEKDQKSYGDRYTKWLAQNPGGIVTEMVDNADNYALFFTANYIQEKLGYYPSKRVLSILPFEVDVLSGLNATAEDASAELMPTEYCYTGSY